jgi:6,7-dimethyl-8-ribityllumazine synthase
MSGAGAPDLSIDSQAWSGMRVAIVAASWHTTVMDGLRSGAKRIAQDAGIEVEEFTVPGSFELPVIAGHAANSGRFDAVVALGVVIRGGTPHFDYVCSAATDGLARVALDSGVPVGFGVLTCDTEEQALDRAGLDGSSEDKGAEAMVSAVNTAAVIRRLKQGS